LQPKRALGSNFKCRTKVVQVSCKCYPSFVKCWTSWKLYWSVWCDDVSEFAIIWYDCNGISHEDGDADVALSMVVMETPFLLTASFW